MRAFDSTGSEWVAPPVYLNPEGDQAPDPFAYSPGDARWAGWREAMRQNRVHESRLVVEAFGRGYGEGVGDAWRAVRWAAWVAQAGGVDLWVALGLDGYPPGGSS